MKKLLFISLLFVSMANFAQSRFDKKEIPAGQEIELKNKKFYINNEQIPSFEIKRYLKENDYKAYSQFNRSKNKSVFGGLLLGLGGTLMISDAVKAMVSDVDYPSAMTYIGGGLAIASIPVLKGKNKKMEEAINTYNNQLKTTSENTTSLNLVANTNGVGLQLSF